MAMMLTLFLGIILVSVMALNFKTATEFVQNQLYTDARNTAHSLGLSLSKVSDPSDVATMQTMINAIFDSGYYERIMLVDINGKILYLRENDVRVLDVPQWFIESVKIQNATGKSSIMLGWSRYGTLEVSSHVGHAYRQLYLTLIDLVKTFVLIGAAVFGMLYLLLSLSLKALARIKGQAIAILDNEFIIERKMPFTTELHSVTQAINAMVAKVKDIFDRENETLLRYHEIFYIDAETKLYNRRYLSVKLPDYLNGETSLCSGVYAIFSYEGLERFKKEYGYESCSTLINLFASKLREEFSEPNTLAIRLNESDFIVIVPSATVEEIEKQTRAVMKWMSDTVQILDNGFEKCALVGCGIGEYSLVDTLKSLLSRADYTVTHAKSKGNFTIQTDHNDADALVLGYEEWRQELERAIAESRVLLAFQSVVDYTDENVKVLHKEILLRLVDRMGTIRSAGYFIPVASRLGMIDTLDRYVIEKVFAGLDDKNITSGTAINLSREFIRKRENREWLRKKLEELRRRNETALWFEVSNSVVLNELESVQILASIIKGFGYRFGIDHFILPEKGAEYLQSVRPDYIKSNVAYLQDILCDKETGNAKESLNILAKSIGIEIIAINVEEAKQLEELKKFGIVQFQGSFVSPVALLKY